MFTQSIFVVQTFHCKFKQDKFKLSCTLFTQNGYYASTCLKLHSYPKLYKEMCARRQKWNATIRTGASSQSPRGRWSAVQGNAI